jgi:RNA recognition motif-containing protein
MRKDVVMRQQKNPQTTKGKEESNQRFTVFVRPVPVSIKEDQLADFFSQVVPVKHSRIVRDKRGKSRGFAYIDLFSRADLQECVRNFNGREFEGKILYVAESKPPSER